MIRHTLLYSGVLFLCVYSWRDWFKPVCALLVLVPLLEHPDMPKQMFGIPGLNPWNVLLLSIVPAWLYGRWRDGIKWDMPAHLTMLILAYAGLIVIGFARLLIEPKPIEATTGELVREFLLNPLKFMLPGLLLFDGARRRHQVSLGLLSVLAIYLMLALLVIKWVPLGEALSGGSLQSRAMRRIDSEIGIHRNNIAVMLAGAFWALLTTRALVRPRALAWIGYGGAFLVLFALALTGGRGGYLAWACVGLVMAALRWRLYLLLGPALVALITWVVPGAAERARHGLGESDSQLSEEEREDVVSSGRLVAWPHMIDWIGRKPLFGCGRECFWTSGLGEYLAELGSSFPHPHNAYIEFLLDNGWFGLGLFIAMVGAFAFRSLGLFVGSTDPLFGAAGAIGFALLSAQLVGGMTGQTFYPSETTVGMWAAVGLALRMSVERSRSATTVRLRAQRARGHAGPAVTAAPAQAAPMRHG